MKQHQWCAQAPMLFELKEEKKHQQRSKEYY
jgi:hypothetical protein